LGDNPTVSKSTGNQQRISGNQLEAIQKRTDRHDKLLLEILRQTKANKQYLKNIYGIVLFYFGLAITGAIIGLLWLFSNLV
jgi:hypothetical protein